MKLDFLNLDKFFTIENVKDFPKKVDVVNIGNFNQLIEEIKANLIRKIVPILEEAFGQVYMHDLSNEDVVDFLQNGDLYLLRDNREKLIGVELLKFITLENTTIMYTGGAAIFPEYQNQHLHRNFRLYMIEKYKPDYIAGRTQNPIVYNIYSRIPGMVYPQFNCVIPESIQKLAANIAQYLHFDNFDPTTLIHKGAYGESIYGKDIYPIIDTSSYTGKLFSTLDINRGDAFLILKDTTKSS
jgi:hypothetical protein